MRFRMIGGVPLLSRFFREGGGYTLRMADIKPIALITGASGGVGGAVATQLADRGYAVALLARSEDKLKQRAEALNEQHGDGTAAAFPCDVSDLEKLDQAVGQVIEHFGRLDAVINAAGKALLKPLDRTDLADWQEVVTVNLNASFTTTRAAWKALIKAGKADGNPIVVNVSSMASKDPFPGFGAYASAKVGVNMLTLVTAREGEKRGIRSVCIAPGAIETDMLRGMFDEKAIPPDQALSPDEVAETIVQCITGQRDFQAGQTIFISK